MEYQFGSFVTWAAFLADGNLLTNHVSLGGQVLQHRSDPPSPSPAIVGSLNTHDVFEANDEVALLNAEFFR